MLYSVDLPTLVKVYEEFQRCGISTSEAEERLRQRFSDTGLSGCRLRLLARENSVTPISKLGKHYAIIQIVNI